MTVDLSADEIRILMDYWRDRLRKSGGKRIKFTTLCVHRIDVLQKAIEEELHKPPELRVVTKAW